MVTAPGPEAPTKKGARRKKHTLTVRLDPSGSDILVHSHAGVHWAEAKDFVREKCGLKPWEPGSGNAASKPAPKKPLPPPAERNHYLAELLRIARHCGHVTFEQLSLIINDLKNACPADEVEPRAIRYAREFGFTDSDAVEALRPEWRAYKAEERARVFAVSYGLHRLLDLRRTGCIDVGRAERRRLTHQRHNSKRRARRAQKPCGRLAKLTKNFLSSSAVTTIRETPCSRKKSSQEEGVSKQIEILEVEDKNSRACVPEARKVRSWPGAVWFSENRRRTDASWRPALTYPADRKEAFRENRMLSKKARKIEAMIALLCERFPRCFAIYEHKRKPLRVGIRNDIIAALGVDGASIAELSLALRCYVANPVYRERLVAGAQRYDLNGEPAGEVLPKHATAKARPERRAKLCPPKSIAAKPATPAPKRLSLADLKTAAAVRRELATAGCG